MEKQPQQLEKWIEPAIDTLDVDKTHLFPKRGGDGNVRYPDCSRS